MFGNIFNKNYIVNNSKYGGVFSPEKIASLSQWLYGFDEEYFLDKRTGNLALESEYLTLNGIDQTVRVNPTVTVDLTKNFTVEVDFFLNDRTQLQTFIGSSQTNVTTNAMTFRYLHGAGISSISLTLGDFTIGSGRADSSTITIANGEPHKAEARRTASTKTVQLYYDNVLVGTQVLTTTLASFQNIQISGRGGLSGAFNQGVNGGLANVKITNNGVTLIDMPLQEGTGNTVYCKAQAIGSNSFTVVNGTGTRTLEPTITPNNLNIEGYRLAGGVYIPKHNSGNVACDNNPLTVSGASKVINAKLTNSNCLSFFGTAYMTIATQVLPTSSYSITLYMIIPTQTSGAKTIYDFRQTDNNGISLILSNATNNLVVRHQGATTYNTGYNPVNQGPLKLNHSRDGTTVTISVQRWLNRNWTTVHTSSYANSDAPLNGPNIVFACNRNFTGQVAGSFAGFTMISDGVTVIDSPFSEGWGETVCNFGVAQNWTLVNFVVPTQWSLKQDIYHHNIRNGFTFIRNICPYSSDISNAVWTKQNTTTELVANTNPLGIPLVSKLTPSNVNNKKSCFSFIGTPYITTNALYYETIIVKSVGNIQRFQLFTTSAMSNNAFVNFDIINGAVGTQNNATGTITALSNGYFQCTILFTSASTIATENVGLAFGPVVASISSRDANYTGDGTSFYLVAGIHCQLDSYTNKTFQHTTLKEGLANKPGKNGATNNPLIPLANLPSVGHNGAETTITQGNYSELYNSFWYTNAGVPKNITHAQILGNTGNRVFADVSITPYKTNILTFSEALSGSDLSKVLSFTNN